MGRGPLSRLQNSIQHHSSANLTYTLLNDENVLQIIPYNGTLTHMPLLSNRSNIPPNPALTPRKPTERRLRRTREHITRPDYKRRTRTRAFNPLNKTYPRVPGYHAPNARTSTTRHERACGNVKWCGRWCCEGGMSSTHYSCWSMDGL